MPRNKIKPPHTPAITPIIDIESKSPKDHKIEKIEKERNKIRK